MAAQPRSDPAHQRACKTCYAVKINKPQHAQ
jgi:hypothetical protein